MLQSLKHLHGPTKSSNVWQTWVWRMTRKQRKHVIVLFLFITASLEEKAMQDDLPYIKGCKEILEIWVHGALLLLWDRLLQHRSMSTSSCITVHLREQRCLRGLFATYAVVQASATVQSPLDAVLITKQRGTNATGWANQIRESSERGDYTVWGGPVLCTDNGSRVRSGRKSTGLDRTKIKRLIKKRVEEDA